MNSFLSLLPSLAWPAAALVIVLFIVHNVREQIKPIVTAVVGSLAASAQRNAGSWAMGFVLAFAASTTALEKVADNFHWIYIAAATQILNPALVTIIALMRPSPASKPSTASTPPFAPPSP